MNKGHFQTVYAHSKGVPFPVKSTESLLLSVGQARYNRDTHSLVYAANPNHEAGEGSLTSQREKLKKQLGQLHFWQIEQASVLRYRIKELDNRLNGHSGAVTSFAFMTPEQISRAAVDVSWFMSAFTQKMGQSRCPYGAFSSELAFTPGKVAVVCCWENPILKGPAIEITGTLDDSNVARNLKARMVTADHLTDIVDLLRHA